MSANKENEETLRQMESRLQQLESQRRREAYERVEKERAERQGRSCAMLWIAIVFTIGLPLVVISDPYLHGTDFLLLLILGIFTLLMWIGGLSGINK